LYQLDYQRNKMHHLLNGLITLAFQGAIDYELICIYQFMSIFVLFKQRSDAATGWTLVLYVVIGYQY